MNEIYEISLLVGIELIGLVFLSFFKINSIFNVLIAFIFGLFIIIQTFLLSLFFVDYISEIALLLLIIFTIIAFYFNRASILELLFTDRTKIDALIFLSITILVVVKPSFISITPDSVHYYIASEAINNNLINTDFFKKFSWFYAKGRLIFLDGLIVSGFILNADLIIYIIPILGFLSLMLIFRIIEINFDINRSQKFFLFFSIFLFSLSIDRFLIHTHYLHSNLITGVFYFFGVIILFCCNKDQKVTIKPWLGILLLAATILIRKEMILFSLIPIIFLFLQNKQNFSYLIKHVLLYLIVGYQWIFYYFLKVGEIKFDMNNLFYSGHGLIQDYIFFFFLTILLTLLAFLIKKIFVKKTVNLFLYFSYLIFLLIISIYNFNETFDTTFKLLDHSILRPSAWGLFWVVLFISLIYSYKNKINNYLLHIIIAFFTLRIGIYVLYDTISDDGGGDRILFTVFFIGMYIIFFSLWHKIKSSTVIKDKIV